MLAPIAGGAGGGGEDASGDGITDRQVLQWELVRRLSLVLGIVVVVLVLVFLTVVVVVVVLLQWELVRRTGQGCCGRFSVGVEGV